MALPRPGNVVIFLTIVVLTSVLLLRVQSSSERNSYYKHMWPVISCHPINTNSSYAPHLWHEVVVGLGLRYCLAYSEKLGAEHFCLEACLLEKLEIIQQGCKQDGTCKDVTLDIEMIGRRFSEVTFYKKGAGADRIVAKVKEEMTKCWDNHPEIRTLKVVGTTPCDPKWTPFLSCVDKAFGCPKKEFSTPEPGDGV